KCLVEVGDQVFDVFDSYRNPYQTIGNAQSGALLGRDGRVGHRCGMGNQRFHSTETFAERAEPDCFENLPGTFAAAEIESNHSANAVAVAVQVLCRGMDNDIRS